MFDTSSVRLIPNADPEPIDPSDWYSAYGDYVRVGRRTVDPQIITYEQALSDAEAAIREAMPELEDIHIVIIAAMCEKVADAARSVELLHEDVITAYEANDIDRVIASLEKASREEREHGDDPATRILADSILEQV